MALLIAVAKSGRRGRPADAFRGDIRATRCARNSSPSDLGADRDPVVDRDITTQGYGKPPNAGMIGLSTVLLLTQQNCWILQAVTSAEFKRWLEKQGCSFSPGRGGHLHVRLGEKRSVLPMHGSGKEIGKGLENRIKKDLGLK